MICTGLENDHIETPADYAERLAALAARKLPFVCANPDLVIHRGADLIYCAGALGQAYEALGGEVTYAGKPYGPIYEVALAPAPRRWAADRSARSPSATASAPTFSAPRPRASTCCSSPAASIATRR